jgi:shikimate kinase
MKASIIYLVGFMGSGKTSVGKRLADLLGWSFADLDARIEERERVAIREIFSLRGESYFRSIEREELIRISGRRELVVALGGGAFCSDENLAIVKSSGTSVWLDVPLRLLQDRCSGDATRPLFTTQAEMDALLERRLPFYAQADLRLDLTDLTIEGAARKILDLLSFSRRIRGRRKGRAPNFPRA